ncbi:MAG TPA: hypothetical protein VF331_01000 [Polyangiales bacterium]
MSSRTWVADVAAGRLASFGFARGVFAREVFALGILATRGALRAVRLAAALVLGFFTTDRA